jgi:4-amino-4-deoxy-L-arabinose transferase-like glycosyltransferase
LNALSHWIRGLSQRYGKRTLIALALIALLGLVVRAYVVVNPVEHPADDSAAYYAISKALYEEQSFGGPEFRDSSDWSPGAPFLYAAAYYATGGAREGTARIVEALLGVATILVVFALGWRLGGRARGRWVGLFAAFAVAVYPPFIHTTGELMSEPPAMLTLPAAVLAFLWAGDRGGTWPWLAPGLLFGLTAMFRPEYLFVGFAFVLLAALRASRGREWRAGLVAALVLLVAFALPIVPWTVRNAIVLDAFVPVSTNSSQTFWAGHNPTANGGATYARGEIYAELQNLPKDRFEIEQAQLLRREALDYMVGHPLRELSLIPRKLLYLSLGDSRAIQSGSTLSQRAAQGAPVTGGITPVVVPTANAAVLLGVVADVAWFGLLALFVLSLVVLWPVLWRNPLGRAGMGLTAISLVLYGFVFYGNFRYRMPLEPIMILLAAPLLTRVWERRSLLRPPA